jgi:hypothetical protein
MKVVVILAMLGLFEGAIGCGFDAQNAVLAADPSLPADEHHTGPFWDAMRTAGFRRLASTEKQGVHAEIWSIIRRGDELQVGWLGWSVGGAKVNPATYSPGEGGELIYKGGTTRQYGRGAEGSFTLSDRMVVYMPGVHAKLRTPKGVSIWIQSFQMPANLQGPVTVVLKLKTYDKDKKTAEVELRGENIPLEAIENIKPLRTSAIPEPVRVGSALLFSAIEPGLPDEFKASAESVAVGNMLLVHGDQDSALSAFSEAIRLNPKYPPAYFFRGQVYEKKGDFDKAIADYSEAIRLNPKYALAYNSRGEIYRKKGDKAKAEEDFAQAKKLGYKAK